MSIINYQVSRLVLVRSEFETTNYNDEFSLQRRPAGIRARYRSPVPVACRKRWLNGAVFWMRPLKPRSYVIAGIAPERCPKFYQSLWRHYVSDIFLNGTKTNKFRFTLTDIWIDTYHISVFVIWLIDCLVSIDNISVI